MTPAPCYSKPMSAGTEKAWGLIEQRGRDEICRESGAVYSPESGCFGLRILGMEFYFCPAHREIRGSMEEDDIFARRHSLYFDHAALWHLALSMSAGRTNRLVRPSDLKGGHHFFTRGTHVLPLDELAARYATDAEGFLKRGEQYGGIKTEYGDASIELMPLPGMPVVLILWVQDDEFPSRLDLLLDSSVEHKVPLDVIWATVMLCVVAMQ